MFLENSRKNDGERVGRHGKEFVCEKEGLRFGEFDDDEK